MADVFNKEVGGVNLRITSPPKDEENWITTESQSHTIDKGEFILTEYNKDFPDAPIDNYDLLLAVVSRSKSLAEWFGITSLKFSDAVQMPYAFKDDFAPDEYKKTFSDLDEYKKNLSLKSSEIELASKEFKSKIKRIESEYDVKNSKIIQRNKFYRVITMNKSDLPITTQILIEKYTPKTGDVTQKRSVYGREILIRFQKGLISLIKNDPNVDIDKVIKEMSVK